MWNCCPPSEPSSSVSFHPSWCVSRVSTREMALCLIPWVVRSSRRSILLEFPFPLNVMSIGVLRTRRQDKDGDRINVHLKCNLDREDYTSLRFPFILPYAWISRRDSCLVGVSCHIPSFWCCLVFASCLNFWKLELGKFGSLKTLNKRRAKTLKSHSLFQNALLKCLIIFGKGSGPNQNIEHF